MCITNSSKRVDIYNAVKLLYVERHGNDYKSKLEIVYPKGSRIYWYKLYKNIKCEDIDDDIEQHIHNTKEKVCCNICQCSINHSSYKRHLKSKKHKVANDEKKRHDDAEKKRHDDVERKRAAEFDKKLEDAARRAAESWQRQKRMENEIIYCDVCDCGVTRGSYKRHLKSKKHKMSLDCKAEARRAVLNNAYQDDPYKILGIERNATPIQIKKVYRQLALQFHPDKGGSIEMFKRILSAYEQLK